MNILNHIYDRYMKNEKVYLPIIIAFSMFMISGVVVNAQKIELSPFIGYETRANVSGGIHGVQGDFTAALIIRLK